MKREIKLFVAVKAFIVKDGKVLILEEAGNKNTGTNPGKFDFPGGKLDLGEKPEAGLLREVKEETGLNVKIKTPFCVNEWQPLVNGKQWQVIGIYFECELVGDAKIEISHEHDSFEWIDFKDYEKYNLMDEPKRAFVEYLAKKIQE